ncbi:lanthionine synthetase C family protein [Streptomyces sp. NPDC050610]|uniref:lanthionine synthetase C family protein n=1 Tax=Streptomyces sp. NPDC050610 TaxID=3157097 RepID=UPI00344418B6
MNNPATAGTARAADAQLRARARHTVADLAQCLADPETVARTALANSAHDPADRWSSSSLAEGHPGVALLFAELAHTKTGAPHRDTVRAHLAIGTTGLRAYPDDGIFTGVPAIIFAAHAARHAPHDYATLLRRLDPVLDRRVRALLDAEDQRLTAKRPGVSPRSYDVISGVTGLGRVLLAREPVHHALLTDVLHYLIRSTAPVRAHGHTVPGWWIPESTALHHEPARARGHFDPGLAHGIAGPLALLALARQSGLHAQGHDEAIETIAEWLLAHRTPDGQWPALITFDQHNHHLQPPSPGRSAWCYGTPGIAHALHLAGTVLNRPSWRRCALDALDRALASPQKVFDNGLCHGWAGLLHLAGRVAHLSDDPRIAAHLPRLAAPILDAYNPATPFGFHTHNPRTTPRHYAGLLLGTAGIALALHAYATNSPPTTTWDSALLLT